MKIKIDSREQSRVKPALNFFRKAEVHLLGCADYLFINDDGKQVGFEYKTIADFIGSIQDRRVFRQAYDMSQAYDKSYILIHGDFENVKQLVYKQSMITSFNYNQYVGALSRLYADYNVIQTTGEFEEVCYLMKKIAEKCFDSKVNIPVQNNKTDNSVFNYLTSIPSISRGKASSIIDHYNLKTLKQLLDIDDFTKVDGIGEKTSDKILEAIK